MALCGAASLATGQSPAKSLPAPPVGFQASPASPSVAAMKAAGVADSMEAMKPNAGWPGCIVDPKVQFTYGWSVVGSAMNIAMMAQAPEDPASVTAGIRDEPAGKTKYKNGVLQWRKVTMPAVGTNCKDIVLYNGSWAGWVSDKMIGVGVSNLYQAKEPGQAWIDEYIDKVIAAVAAK